jgi:hypothetical protein
VGHDVQRLRKNWSCPKGLYRKIVIRITVIRIIVTCIRVCLQAYHKRCIIQLRLQALRKNSTPRVLKGRGFQPRRYWSLILGGAALQRSDKRPCY